jgi:phosphatidylinositol-3-phosphatase
MQRTFAGIHMGFCDQVVKDLARIGTSAVFQARPGADRVGTTVEGEEASKLGSGRRFLEEYDWSAKQARQKGEGRSKGMKKYISSSLRGCLILLVAIAFGSGAGGSQSLTPASTDDGAAMSGASSAAAQPTTPRSKHVVMVMEENQSYSTVVGQTAVWPNLNRLINEGALPTNYYADSHPSIGNYFMLTTGQLLTTNDNSTTVWDVDSTARRMIDSGVPFRVYAEGISRGYVGGNTGLYLVRHNPFARLSDIADNAKVADEHIWPFSQFKFDLAAGALPEFSFIVPDVNDDAHNGTPQEADSWLQKNVISLLSSRPAFKPGGDGILIVDFDEAADSDTRFGGGHVSPVLWGPEVLAGYKQKSTTIYQHQSMLRTVMEALGLSDPPADAATAPAMSEFFVQK